ncbi:MAG: hypothetical protein A2Y33_16320 [Spirochaetes bacterium GWF1_51_8]|nr:MAG: hypothetical protein A2Y33_16320 [Spirochaetes bacterium GWF1_51_8]
MKRFKLFIAVIALFVAVVSCSPVYTPLLITSNPITVPAPKVGYSTNHLSGFGSIGGDGSINTAVKNGGISKIYYVDFIYLPGGQRITAVYGE